MYSSSSADSAGRELSFSRGLSPASLKGERSRSMFAVEKRPASAPGSFLVFFKDTSKTHIGSVNFHSRCVIRDNLLEDRRKEKMSFVTQMLSRT